jgi:hypothetical protein
MYTSQGLMTHEDYADHLKDTDNGTTTVDLDDPPLWFDASPTTVCANCRKTYAVHEDSTVTVQDASGEVIACSEKASYL